MALRDYEALDEEEFYGQPFEKRGVVSIWAGTTVLSGQPAELDVLQDWCGVGYYDLDFNEPVHEGFRAVAVEHLLRQLSYSQSFVADATAAARAAELPHGRWVLAQFDFRYSPSEVGRPVDDRATFLGSFQYNDA